MAERIVPDMDTLPITGLTELIAHLDELDNDATSPIQPKLFDDVELQLTDANSSTILPTLLPRLTALLFHLTTQNPSPLLSLLIKLLAPIPFQRILPLTTPDALLLALRSPLPGANILALSILQKAAASTEDVKVLVQLWGALIGEVVSLWVGTGDVGVAEKAERVLREWLEMDCGVVIRTPEAVNGVDGFSGGSAVARQRSRLSTPGEGLIWRLVFENLDNLTRIIANCTLSLPESITSALPPGSSTRPQNDITLSQGRLLRLLPHLVVLNFKPLITNHSTLFESFGITSTNLLSWAALEMVDTEDVLMRLMVVDFFETLVSVARVAQHQGPEKDEVVRHLVREATGRPGGDDVRAALLTLPDRTVEEEAEALREYLKDIVN